MNMRLRQILLAAGAIAIAFAVYKSVFNPYASREKAVAQELAAIDGDWSLGEVRESDPPPVQAQRVLARDDLWTGLVEPPKPKAKPLDIDSILKGIEPTSRTQGTGQDMRARIRTPLHPRGEYYGIGDAIEGTRGIKVKAVGKDYVVFSVMHNGQEHEKKVPR